jgi:effector-binding domain-containing protein
MPYDIQIREVPQQTFAAVRGQANAHNIGDRIIALLSEVWDFLKDPGIRQTGHNVVLYSDEASKALLRTEDEVSIEVGVQVATPFESQGHVVCSAIPGGTVATVVHLGPYQKLPEAHTAVREWCAEHGHPLAGPNWEIYGHWTDNPNELRTDVFYLLQ